MGTRVGPGRLASRGWGMLGTGRSMAMRVRGMASMRSPSLRGSLVLAIAGSRMAIGSRVVRSLHGCTTWISDGTIELLGGNAVACHVGSVVGLNHVVNSQHGGQEVPEALQLQEGDQQA